MNTTICWEEKVFLSSSESCFLKATWKLTRNKMVSYEAHSNRILLRDINVLLEWNKISKEVTLKKSHNSVKLHFQQLVSISGNAGKIVRVSLYAIYKIYAHSWTQN